MMMTIRMPPPVMLPSNCRINKPFSFLCEIIDPESKFVNNCNHILLFVCLFSLYVDPLFGYLLVVNDGGSIALDIQLGVSVAFLRVIGDSFLFLGIILRFRTSFEEIKGSHVFGKRELVKDRRIIAVKYLKSSFVIDLLASLPFPQVYLWYCILTSKTSQAANVYYNLSWIVFVQCYLRALSTLKIYRKIEKITGIAIRNPWSGTLYTLFVYGMISHLLGAMYYYMFASEVLQCRETVFRKKTNATMHELDQLLAKCYQENDAVDGVLSEAFVNKVGSRSYAQKYMFCFSWGLKTLSSMGQNLNSSVLILDTTFNLIIVVIGLVVFADLIARMQTCMQSVGELEEQQMVTERKLEEWANFHQLPSYLKKRLRQNVQYHLHATRGICDEAILDSLPTELSCEIRRYLYLELVQNLPIFGEMDGQLLHAMCGHLTTFTGAEGMYIVLEGDPVQQLLFIFSGQLEVFSINGGSSRSITVGPGDLCSQELLAWCSLSSASTHKLPSSTHTVKCLTDVEAFALKAKNVKTLAMEFKYDQNFFDALSRPFS